VQKRDTIAKANGVAADDAPLGLSDRAQAAIKAVARILAPFKDEITDEDLDALQAAIGMAEGIDEQQEHEGEAEPVKDSDAEDKEVELEEKLGKDLHPEEGKPSEDRNQSAPVVAKAADGIAMECPQGVDKEHHDDALLAAKDAYQKHLEEKGYIHKNLEEDAMSKESVLKSLDLSAFPQPQREQMRTLFLNTMEEQKKLVLKAKTLEDELRHERDLRLEQEYMATAAEIAPMLAEAERKDFATILKSLNATDKNAAGKLEAILKSAHAQYADGIQWGGLFSEHGSKLSGNGTGSAEAKLDALVDSVVMKAAGEKTREQIYKQVLMSPEGKKLWREIENQKNGI